MMISTKTNLFDFNLNIDTDNNAIFVELTNTRNITIPLKQSFQLDKLEDDNLKEDIEEMIDCFIDEIVCLMQKVANEDKDYFDSERFAILS